MYQLRMKDEYNQQSILFSDKDLFKAQERLQKELNFMNVDNALTLDAKNQNWEYFSVKCYQKDKNDCDYIYIGQDGRGTHQIYNIQTNKTVPFDLENNKNETIIKDGDIEITIKIYLGVLDNKEWFATVPSKEERGKYIEIQTLSHQLLKEKNLLYISVV